jgi:hypothetical protein
MNADMYDVVKPMMKGDHAVFARSLGIIPEPLPPLPLMLPLLAPLPLPVPVPVPIPAASQQKSPMMAGGQVVHQPIQSRQSKKVYQTTPVW